MKAIFNTIFAGMLIICCASCSKESVSPQTEPDQGLDFTIPVSLNARIANDPGSKATLDDSSGSLAFSTSDPKDVIKVYNGSGLYSSTNVSVSGSVATFTMQDGFSDTGSGFAAFPASSVSEITGSGVTFNLPSIYTYAEVGGAEANAARVPCPMIASYSAGNELVFKQAGAVVRFRVTQCVAGDITFTFTSPVTGSVTLNAVPSGTGDGVLSVNLSNPGYSITVTGVPDVTTGYIYITLPVPTGTDPVNVGVWNKGTSVNMVATKSGTAVSLPRANGAQRTVKLKDVKDEAKFAGKILAGDLYYIGNYNYGIMEDPLEVLKYYSVNYTTSGNTEGKAPVYFFNWNFFNDTNKSFNFTIGGKNYKVPSSGNSGDWAGIAGTATSRQKAKVKGTDARYAYLTVTGLASETYHTSSIGGLLLFPDNAIIAVPSGAKLEIFDAVDGDTYNVTTNNNTISLGGFRELLSQGCSFIPTAGYWNNSSWYTLYWGRDWYGINEAGSYWSDSAYSSDHAYALTILRNHTTYEKPNLIDPSAHDEKGNIYLPVRLIRVPPATP